MEVCTMHKKQFSNCTKCASVARSRYNCNFISTCFPLHTIGHATEINFSLISGTLILFERKELEGERGREGRERGERERLAHAFNVFRFIIFRQAANGIVCFARFLDYKRRRETWDIIGVLNVFLFVSVRNENSCDYSELLFLGSNSSTQ